MLIIFDLDDTLIDTSGSVTPGVLLNALLEVQKQGHKFTDFDKALNDLLTLNKNKISARKAIFEFMQLNNIREKYIKLALESVYERPNINKSVSPLLGAVEVLEYLSKRYLLGLVSKGKKSIQLEKMKKAGIHNNLFSKIYFTTKNNKKSYYAAICAETGVSPSSTIVCGDRISVDLSPAKELNCKTVHIRWGRGLGDTGSNKDVDFTILHLSELKALTNRLQKVG